MCATETAFAVEIVGGLGSEEGGRKVGEKVVGGACGVKAGDVVMEGAVWDW